MAKSVIVNIIIPLC